MKNSEAPSNIEIPLPLSLNLRITLKDEKLKELQEELDDVVKRINHLFDKINEIMVPENFDFAITEDMQ